MENNCKRQTSMRVITDGAMGEASFVGYFYKGYVLPAPGLVAKGSNLCSLETISG
jgi:hypothetical protein